MRYFGNKRVKANRVARIGTYGLLLGLVAVGSWAIFAARPAEPRRPNIVIVLTDQWRAQDVGYAGNRQVRTPQLDSLAAESVNFRLAVSNLSVCAPARASLLTGQYPLRHGVFYNDRPLPTEAVTLGDVCKAAGYQTGYIGKWHLNGSLDSTFHESRNSPIPAERRQGFDFWKVFECTHDYNRSPYFNEANVRFLWKGYDAFDQTKTAVEYIEQHAANPFLLVVSYGPPHDPYQTAPKEYRQLYADVAIALRPNVPDSLRVEAQRTLKGYYAHMTALDRCVGELQAALRKTGVEDNTIFVFTSDHGDMIYSQGEINKQKPWDESIRIPFLLKYPRELGREARTLDAPFGVPDIMPTLLSLAKVDVPRSVEGKDFMPYVAGKKKAKPLEGTLLLCPVPFHQWNYAAGGKEYRGIRTTRYTYVRDRQGPWLLYDNEKDPYQQRNLCDQPSTLKTQRALDKELQKMLRATNDDFQPGEVYLQRWGYPWHPKDRPR